MFDSSAAAIATIRAELAGGRDTFAAGEVLALLAYAERLERGRALALSDADGAREEVLVLRELLAIMRRAYRIERDSKNRLARLVSVRKIGSDGDHQSVDGGFVGPG